MANFAYKIGGTGTILTDDQVKQNVSAIQAILTGYGWTLTAIAGALGCFQEEASMNPGIYETSHSSDISNLPYFAGGMGLAQWTDYPAYQAQYPNPLPWSAEKEGKDWWDGNFQCWLLTKAADDNYTSMGYGEGARWGWQTSSRYPSISFADFQKYDGSVDMATEYWFYCFEWHYWEVPSGYLEARKTAARKWYEYMSGQPVPPTPTENRKMPLWFYLRKM